MSAIVHLHFWFFHIRSFPTSKLRIHRQKHMANLPPELNIRMLGLGDSGFKIHNLSLWLPWVMDGTYSWYFVGT